MTYELRIVDFHCYQEEVVFKLAKFGDLSAEEKPINRSKSFEKWIWIKPSTISAETDVVKDNLTVRHCDLYGFAVIVYVVIIYGQYIIEAFLVWFVLLHM